MMLQADDLLPSVVLATGDNPTHTIIWMHGLGADGNDFVPIVRELYLPSSVSIRFIFPHAPLRPVTINNGYVMRAWYDIYHGDLLHQEDEIGIRDSQKAINKLIDYEIQSGINSDKIFLAGFSQGGAMALHVGLRQTNKLAGILALSCYLPLAKTLLTEARPVNSSISIFMAHGNRDTVIPISLARATKQILLEAKYQVEWHEYGMEHAVCAEEIADISSWIRKILG